MKKDDGEQLTSIEVHDIICYIADAVLAGGIRRAALISLFSADDVTSLAPLVVCQKNQISIGKFL